MAGFIQGRSPVSGSRWSSGRAWVAAALLVLASAIAVAVWADQTASSVDRNNLERGAEAVNRNLESEIRVVEMASDVIVAAAAAADDPEDFASVAITTDPVVLESLIGLVSYPITEMGTGEGHVFFQVNPEQEVAAPDLGLPAIVTSTLVEEDVPYLSPAYREAGTSDVRMVVVVPSVQSGESVLVGAIFLPNRILDRAVSSVGEDEYSAILLDRRFGGQLITSTGTPTGKDIIRFSPVGFAGLIDLEVMGGTAFSYSRSPWIPAVSLTVGITIALLLLGLASMTRARTREMRGRLELARLHDEGKDRFLATVSHELRTPLTVVMGGASEVESQWETLSSSEREELLGMVVNQAQEASNLVEDLLVVARSEYGNVRIAMDETHIQRHIGYAVESVSLVREGTLTVTAEDPKIYADGTRLRQILRNLVHNAVAHGGPNIEIEVSHGEGVAHVSVLDDGPAIPHEDCERIFEPYARANGRHAEEARGIGIGLYVSRLLARIMGGELVYLRRDGRTEFLLTLPAVAEDVAPSQHLEPVSVE